MPPAGGGEKFCLDLQNTDGIPPAAAVCVATVACPAGFKCWRKSAHSLGACMQSCGETGGGTTGGGSTGGGSTGGGSTGGGSTGGGTTGGGTEGGGSTGDGSTDGDALKELDACTDSSECESGLVCVAESSFVASRCHRRCTSVADCGPGETCIDTDGNASVCRRVTDAGCNCGSVGYPAALLPLTIPGIRVRRRRRGS